MTTFYKNNMEQLKNLKMLFKQKKLLITIDGPSGVGKTTVSQKLAKRVGYRYLDTGALYRGIAFFLSCSKKSYDTDEKLSELLGTIKMEMPDNSEQFTLILNGQDVTEDLRTAKISMLASKISAIPLVREFLFSIQREMGEKKQVIAEGRDMGTIVFPEADLKFYLDAPHDVRALRRFKDVSNKGNQTFDAVEKDLKQRDYNDSHRTIAPLIAAEDAIHIDSSSMAIDQVVEMMIKMAYEKCHKI